MLMVVKRAGWFNLSRFIYLSGVLAPYIAAFEVTL